jgi:iron complex outermembrane recepter protein
MPAKGAKNVYRYSGQSAQIYYVMKAIVCLLSVSIGSLYGFSQSNTRFNDTSLIEPVEIKAVRAPAMAPFAKTNLSKKDITAANLGQDIPFLLNATPGVVVNSDAGNGVGYTGIRIRGTDATRINVTLNGIPYNDAESQGTFFVNLPDFSSSVNSIQIQRGVGTSTNGAGAFGASINLSTNELRNKAYAELSNSAGAFNTWKHSFQAGTGLLGKHFTFDARLSQITSDGFIDRAATTLRSYFTSTAYTDAKQSLRLNIFSGKEKTYQAWYGVPEPLLNTNRKFNGAGTEKPGEPYDNETDNYLQTHYQLFYNRTLNTNWILSTATFLTRGKGYFEQYKAAQQLEQYGLPDFFSGGTLNTTTDLIRQLWLNNYFYGSNISFQYQGAQNDLVLGGNWNRYDGRHYGIVKWAALTGSVPDQHRWYNTDATKQEAALFGKWTTRFKGGWQSFVDLQYRAVQYTINGFRNTPALRVSNSWGFFNPKLGITWADNRWRVFGSYAIANKEPNRDDFETGAAQAPKPEQLHDVEIGAEYRKNKLQVQVNGYAMLYRNQLVLTGKINDVGAQTRTNIASSYRIGIELQAAQQTTTWLKLEANLCISSNKVRNFTEYIDDYDNGGQVLKQYRRTDISFSPGVIANGILTFTPVKNASIQCLNRYVGRQYLDNTSQKSRSLDPFTVQDWRFSYVLPFKKVKDLTLMLHCNNVWNVRYEPNGYTFSYIAGGMATTENYYFPMAGINVMGGITMRL